MARPIKQGIEYFPFDVGFLQDIKVRRIMRGCGPQAIPVIISLLSTIYREEGYYMEWTTDMPFLVADEVGISEGAVTEIVEKAVQVELFSQEKWDSYRILTSEGIQRRYFKAVERRKEVPVLRDYLLNPLDEHNNLINVDSNPINDNESTQRKVKESKVKNICCTGTLAPEMEDPKKPVTVSPTNQDGDTDPLWIAYKENINSLPTPTEAQKLEGLLLAGAEKDLIIEAVYEAAENNKRSVNYVAAIVQNCLKDGVKTALDFKARQKNWELQKRSKQTSRKGKPQNAGNFKGRDMGYTSVDSLKWLTKGEGDKKK